MNLNSPATLSALERFNFLYQVSQFDESKHLKEREKQYACNLNTHGIIVVKETDDGWWHESYDFKNDLPKQLQKIKDDPSVAIAFINQSRFNEPRGWYDPNG